jgi:NlpC/P60 family
MSSVQQAITNGLAAVKGTQVWNDLCLSFVAHMYGFQASGTPSPKTAYNAWVHTPSQYKHNPDTEPNPGALMYWRISPGAAGHVAIYLGQGKMLSTHGHGGAPTIYNVSDVHLPMYVGWADPVFAANGYQLPSDYGSTTFQQNVTSPSTPFSNGQTGGSLNNISASGTINAGKVVEQQSLAGFAGNFLTNPVGAISDLLSNVDPVKAIGEEFSRFLWITFPSSWVRINAGLYGVILIILAIILFAWEGTSSG